MSQDSVLRQPRSVLVTGAQGFVGRYLVSRILELDSNVRVLGIGRSPAYSHRFTHELAWNGAAIPAPLPPSIKNVSSSALYSYIPVDLLERERLIEVLRSHEPNVIFHLVSGLRDDPAEKLHRSGKLALRSLIEAVISAGVPIGRMVIASTGAVYACQSERHLPFHEDAPIRPNGSYAAAKLAVEDEGRMAAEKHGLPVVVARLFNLVGPGQYERHVCGSFANRITGIKAGLQPPLLAVGSLDTTRDFIDVRDAVNALLHLAEHAGTPQTYNVASGRETRIRDLLELMMMRSGQSNIEVHEYPRPSGPQRHYADAGKIRRMAFVPAKSIEESVDDLLCYYERTVMTNA